MMPAGCPVGASAFDLWLQQALSGSLVSFPADEGGLYFFSGGGGSAMDDFTISAAAAIGPLPCCRWVGVWPKMSGRVGSGWLASRIQSWLQRRVSLAREYCASSGCHLGVTRIFFFKLNTIKYQFHNPISPNSYHGVYGRIYQAFKDNSK